MHKTNPSGPHQNLLHLTVHQKRGQLYIFTVAILERNWPKTWGRGNENKGQLESIKGEFALTEMVHTVNTLQCSNAPLLGAGSAMAAAEKQKARLAKLRNTWFHTLLKTKARGRSFIEAGGSLAAERKSQYNNAQQHLIITTDLTWFDSFDGKSGVC